MNIIYSVCYWLMLSGFLGVSILSGKGNIKMLIIGLLLTVVNGLLFKK